METADLNLGPSKIPTKRKASLNSLQYSGNQPEHPVSEEKVEEEEPSTGHCRLSAVDLK